MCSLYHVFFKGKQKGYISQPLLDMFYKHMTESDQYNLGRSILNHFQMWFLKTFHVFPSYVPSPKATNGSVQRLKEIKCLSLRASTERHPICTKFCMRKIFFYIYITNLLKVCHCGTAYSILNNTETLKMQFKTFFFIGIYYGFGILWRPEKLK